MDRIKLIKSDTYWISKINTLLYHKNYRGIERRKVLVNEILIIKNELIRAMGEKEQEPSEALHKHDVVGRSEQLNPDLDRGDFVEYIGGSNSKYLTKGEKYRLTGRMWGNRIAVIGSHNKRLNTLQRYFIGV